MFTWDKNLDDVLQGVYCITILGLITLMLIIGSCVGFVGFYGYKFLKGDLIVQDVSKDQVLGNSE